MRSQKERVVRQRQFGMPTKNVTKRERGEEARPQQGEPETGRYLLQVDRQTKRSFNTPEAAQSAAMEIKTRFPALQENPVPNKIRPRLALKIGRAHV